MAIRDTNGGQGSSQQLKSVRERFADTGAVNQAVNNALRDVRKLHKRMGVGLVGTRNGKIVEIPPEEIQIDEPTASPPAP